MTLQADPIARAQMLIRKPAAVVFEAFVDPAITSQFWFTRGSGRVEAGADLTWYWDMYGVSARVAVKVVEHNRRILIEWPTLVEWLFTRRTDNTTFVSITAFGFTGTDDEKVAQAIDLMGGFSLVLAGCKAYLEHGVLVKSRRRSQP
jgi:uncharacterized protein YndB with AHSA1/START domain